MLAVSRYGDLDLSKPQLGQCNSASITVPSFKKIITRRMDIENGVYFVDHGQGSTYFKEKRIELPFIFSSRLINDVPLLTILAPTSLAPCLEFPH